MTGTSARWAWRARPSRKRLRSAKATRPWRRATSTSASGSPATSYRRARPAPRARRGRPRHPGRRGPRAGARSRSSTRVRARPRSALRSPQGPIALERDALVEGLEQHVVASREALVQPFLPGLGEHEVGLGLVGGAEAGHHPALERALLEDGRAERVDGGDLGTLQHLQGRRASRALRLRSGRLRPRPLQPLAQAQLQGGGGVLGEGDGGDLLEPGVAGAEERAPCGPRAGWSCRCPRPPPAPGSSRARGARARGPRRPRGGSGRSQTSFRARARFRLRSPIL